jgi:hypothetical protein
VLAAYVLLQRGLRFHPNFKPLLTIEKVVANEKIDVDFMDFGDENFNKFLSDHEFSIEDFRYVLNQIPTLEKGGIFYLSVMNTVYFDREQLRKSRTDRVLAYFLKNRKPLTLKQIAGTTALGFNRNLEGAKEAIKCVRKDLKVFNERRKLWPDIYGTVELLCSNDNQYYIQAGGRTDFNISYNDGTDEDTKNLIRNLKKLLPSLTP